jgi:hypothetical protein
MGPAGPDDFLSAADDLLLDLHDFLPYGFLLVADDLLPAADGFLLAPA